MFTRSEEDVVEEIEIFGGSQNRIMFQNVYCKDFKGRVKISLQRWTSIKSN
jgi:hypothetical protein